MQPCLQTSIQYMLTFSAMYCTCAKSTKALLSKNILTNILSIQHMD